MLNNLIFSITVVLPIFLVMFTGNRLKEQGFLTDDFLTVANRLVYFVCVPIKLMTDLWQVEIAEGFSMTYGWYIVLALTANAGIAYGIARFLKMNPKKIGAFVQGSFRGNYVYVGLALLESITGTVDYCAHVVMAFSITTFSVVSTIALSPPMVEKDFKSVLYALIKILKNPMIIGIALGLVLNGLQVPKFPLALKTLKYFAVLASPLALLSIGGSFKLQVSKINALIALVATGLKLVLFPLLALIGGVILGFSPIECMILFLIFGTPTAINSYIIALSMGGDGELASTIVMYTTLLSVITTTCFVFVFRLLGWV